MANNCRNRNCIHEWCDRNRKGCCAIVPGPTPDIRVNCPEKATWLAPFPGPLFPLSYCADHTPRSENQHLAKHDE
jgi:hypothetical protein